MAKGTNDIVDALSKILGNKELTGLLAKLVDPTLYPSSDTQRKGDPLDERIYQQVKDGLRYINPEKPLRYNWQHTDSGLTIKFEVPGVEVSDISVKVKEDLLAVHIGKDPVRSKTFTPGKRKFDKDLVKVTYKLGVLTINIPFVDEDKDFSEVKIDLTEE